MSIKDVVCNTIANIDIYIDIYIYIYILGMVTSSSAALQILKLWKSKFLKFYNSENRCGCNKYPRDQFPKFSMMEN